MRFEYYQLPPHGMLTTLDVGEWRWRLKAGNGEIIASGEGFINEPDCLHSIELVKSTNGITPIVRVQG